MNLSNYQAIFLLEPLGAVLTVAGGSSFKFNMRQNEMADSTPGQPTFTDNDVYCSDENFELINSFAQSKTEQEAKEAVHQLDEEVQNVLKADGFADEHRNGILILLQARNYFARLANIEQIGLAEGFHHGVVQEVPPPDPLAHKHVAIFGSETVSKTLVHVLRNVPLADGARLKAYSSMPELIQAIGANQVVGVLALHHRGGSIVDSMRHDYKNLPGKTRQDAEEFVFPPTVDVSSQTPLLEMVERIRQMSKGERIELTKFNLKSGLPQLMVHAIVPEKLVSILIVDDERKYIETMEEVLYSWPNITVGWIIHEDGMPSVPAGRDIVLLDESLNNEITGGMVHRSWIENGFTGLVASTTGGSKPLYVKHHFGCKGSIATNYESAMEFVRFINVLLSEL